MAGITKSTGAWKQPETRLNSEIQPLNPQKTETYQRAGTTKLTGAWKQPEMRLNSEIQPLNQLQSEQTKATELLPAARSAAVIFTLEKEGASPSGSRARAPTRFVSPSSTCESFTPLGFRVE